MGHSAGVSKLVCTPVLQRHAAQSPTAQKPTTQQELFAWKGLKKSPGEEQLNSSVLRMYIVRRCLHALIVDRL